MNKAFCVTSGSPEASVQGGGERGVQKQRHPPQHCPVGEATCSGTMAALTVLCVGLSTGYGVVGGTGNGAWDPGSLRAGSTLLEPLVAYCGNTKGVGGWRSRKVCWGVKRVKWERSKGCGSEWHLSWGERENTSGMRVKGTQGIRKGVERVLRA